MRDTILGANNVYHVIRLSGLLSVVSTDLFELCMRADFHGFQDESSGLGLRETLPGI